VASRPDLLRMAAMRGWAARFLGQARAIPYGRDRVQSPFSYRFPALLFFLSWFAWGSAMTTSAAEHRPVVGLVAFFVGVIALIAVTLHISGTFAEPEKSAATTIGEIAAEIRDSAKRALSNAPAPAPEPPSRTWNADRILMFAVPLLAGVAAVLGAIGLFRREAPTLPAIGIAMGVSAFVMQYVFWLALVIGGICLLIAIVNNIDGILGS
jgi:hypothetical protein